MVGAQSLAETILNRIKELEGVSKDKDLAALLLSDPKNLSAWKNRDIIPWDRLVEYSRKKRVSLEYLINGQGPPYLRDMVMEPGAIYKVETNHDALYEISEMVYRAVRESTDKLTADKYAQLVRMAHRESLDRGGPVPYAKIVELVKLAT